MKIKVGILDSDVNYLQRMTIAFTSRFPDKIEVYSFTKEDIAIEEANDRNLDVFLAGTEYKIDISQLPPKCGFAYLVDAQDIEAIDDVETVAKFQKAELIYKKILSIYSEKAANISKYLLNDNIKTKIIYFTSSSGGCGTSTAASAAAKRLAKYGKRVLYLNLEDVPSTNLFFHGEGESTMSDIIYAIKSKKANLGLKIESSLRHDEYGVNFFASSEIALDMCELNMEDINSLITEIQISDNVDVVIIDGKFTFDKDRYQLMDRCTDCIFVCDGSECAREKFTRAYKCLEIMAKQYGTGVLDKVKILYNRFSSKTSSVIENESVHMLGGINRFDGASVSEIVAQIMEKTFFDELM